MIQMQRLGGVEYRLGDLFYGYLERKGVPVREVFCDKWRGSIACEYAMRRRRSQDLDCLLSIVRERRGNLPSNCTLVVHLRIGDVLDWDVYKRRFGCTQERGCNWVHPISYYSRVQVPPPICKVEIVGNPFYRTRGTSRNESEKYAARVISHFSTTHPSRLLTPRSADEDFVYMSFSSFFLPSKGKFSRLVSTLVEREGGTIVGVNRTLPETRTWLLPPRKG